MGKDWVGGWVGRYRPSTSYRWVGWWVREEEMYLSAAGAALPEVKRTWRQTKNEIRGGVIGIEGTILF